jgi:hypothetical protein
MRSRKDASKTKIQPERTSRKKSSSKIIQDIRYGKMGKPYRSYVEDACCGRTRRVVRIVDFSPWPVVLT